MGLLVLAGVAALVLTLLTLLTFAVVQLVLLVTVRNTLLVALAIGFYWFVDSRRRQVAKGFYSCTEVPGSGNPNASVTAKERKPKGEKLPAQSVMKKPNVKKQISDSKQDALGAGEKSAQTERQSTRAREQDSVEAELKTLVRTGVDELGGAGAMRQSDVSDSGVSSCDEVPVAAAAAAATSSPSSSSSSTPSSPRAGMQLPDLRRRKWKFPTQSMPLKPKGEALLQHGRRATGGSASNSPRRPELYGSPRSVAMEQKLMKSALESDGYWIGDFRVPPPMPKRSHSLGAKTQQAAAAASTISKAMSTRTVQEKRPAAKRV